jgi:uncharacterized small protein (DUF1192 family)
MSKESFSWKSLFVNDTEESFPKSPTPAPASPPADETRFPADAQTMRMPASGNTSLNNPFVDEIVQVYEKGVDSLNMDGFDFFEMYRSVMAVGPTNPQSYQMAFAMGKTIKSDLTKEFLLEKSRYYIDEIEKVYAKYSQAGNTRKIDLDTSLTRDKVNLSKSISDLEDQIAALQQELEAKKAQRSQIDAGSHEQYTEIQQKIEANNFAKAKIIDSINLVVSGINQFL